VDNLLITQILPREPPLSNKNNAGQDIQPFTPLTFLSIPKSRYFSHNLLLINTLHLFTNLLLKIVSTVPAAVQNYARIPR